MHLTYEHTYIHTSPPNDLRYDYATLNPTYRKRLLVCAACVHQRCDIWPVVFDNIAKTAEILRLFLFSTPNIARKCWKFALILLNPLKRQLMEVLKYMIPVYITNILLNWINLVFIRCKSN